MTRRTFLEAGVVAAVASTAANSAERPSGARFVWYDAHGEGRNTFALFRKAFTASGLVQSATLRVFADTSYRLFVNGQFVDFGPVRCDPRFPLYDTHEIAPLLRPGRNVIAIEFFSMEQSLCHAWSASPAYYLSKHVLGIQFPEAPNLEVVRIEVQVSTITEAEGQWPHPRGTIDVKWHMAGGRRVFDYVHAPAGVKAIGG